MDIRILEYDELVALIDGYAVPATPNTMIQLSEDAALRYRDRKIGPRFQFPPPDDEEYPEGG